MIEPVLLYLDPGTGATLVQLALAGTVGLAAAGKLHMNKIKRRLERDSATELDQPQEQPNEESAPAE